MNRTTGKESQAESYAMLRAVFEVTTDVVFVKDLQGRYLLVNPAFASFLNKTEDEILGRSDLELYAPEIARQFMADDHEVLGSGKTQVFEGLARGPMGEQAYRVTKGVVRDAEGTVTGVFGISHDMKDRLRAENERIERVRAEAAREESEEAVRAKDALLKELQESEERYRSLLENANDIIYAHDLEGNYITINRAGEKITGFTREEILGGLNIAEVVAPQHLEQARRMIAQKVRDPAPTIYEVDIITRDGRRLTLEVSTRLSQSEEKPPVIQGIARDVTERKRLEEEYAQLLNRIAEERERLASIVSNVPGVVWEAWGQPDASEQRINFVNEYVESMIGYSVEEWLSQPNFWLSLVHPDDRESAAENAAAHFAKGGSNVNRFRWVARDGRVLYVESHSSVVTDEAGRPIGMRGVTLDITDRQLAEEAVREAGARLRFALDAARLGDWYIDLKTRKTTRSARHAEIFGYDDPASDWNYDLFLEHVHSDDRAFVDEHFQRSVGIEGLWNIECRIVRPDGQIRWIHSQGCPYRTPDGNVVGYLGIIQDITERKVFEHDRERSLVLEQKRSSQLNRLAEASLAINSMLSIEDLVHEITEHARDLTGANLAFTSFTVDQNWDQAITARSLSEKFSEWRDFDGKLNGSGIYSLVCRSNKPMRLTQKELESHPGWRGFGQFAGGHPPLRGWLAVPITRHSGQNIGVIQVSDKVEGEFSEEDEAILVQLAQLASAAIENARLYRESAEANRLKDEFLATVSHELRTPLTAMLGWAQMLSTGKIDEKTREHAITTIARNARAQAQIVDDVLDVSRIITGKLRLDLREVDPVLAVEAAVETVRPMAQAKGVTLEVVSATGIAPVMGDLDRLQQVAWNLLVNATKFTPTGGQVQVRLEQVETSVRLEVRDTGVGINPAFLPHVFDRFRQADSSTTREFGGLGLGLSIVRHLVELHGGAVRAASEGFGQGATFTVTIPTVKLSPTVQSRDESSIELLGVVAVEEQETSIRVLAGLRVLVVDDDVDALAMFSAALKLSGCEARTANSAAQALQIAAVWMPDALISDIGMPKEDGYYLIQKLRSMESEGKPPIPALAVTGYARNEDRARVLSAGFDGFLSKPVNPATLIEAVAQLAGGKEKEREKG